MKRLKLKGKSKFKLKDKITLLFIFLIIFVILFLKYSNKKILPTLMKYAQMETKKMALEIMSNSIDEEILNILDKEDIFSITKNKDSEISSIDFNPVVVNKVLARTSNIVSNNLKNIEKGKVDGLTFINEDDYDLKKLKNGVIAEIPMGIITNNALLSNLGPKVPVKINLVGNVISNVGTKVENYGINSIMVEVYAHVEVTEEVIIPFNSKEVTVSNDIPIAIKIVQGRVPDYYNDGALNKNSSSLSVPIDIDN